MKTKEQTNVSQKASVEAANDRDVYEETKFGRRKISKIPKPILKLFGLALVPFVFLYRRFSGGRSG